MADRLVILHESKVIKDGSPQAIKRHNGARKITCTTTLEPHSLRAIHGVRSLTVAVDLVTLLTDDAERLVRELLARDPGSRNLEVSGARLDEAFLTLTGGRVEGGLHVEAAAV